MGCTIEQSLFFSKFFGVLPISREKYFFHVEARQVFFNGFYAFHPKLYYKGLIIGAGNLGSRVSRLEVKYGYQFTIISLLLWPEKKR